MTYKTLKLNIDEQIYSQVVSFLKLLPANQCLIDEEENQLTVQQRFAALAGSWEGEELQRAPQETITTRLELE